MVNTTETETTNMKTIEKIGDDGNSGTEAGGVDEEGSDVAVVGVEVVFEDCTGLAVGEDDGLDEVEVCDGEGDGIGPW
jgi:hypothetical protein